MIWHILYYCRIENEYKKGCMTSTSFISCRQTARDQLIKNKRSRLIHNILPRIFPQQSARLWRSYRHRMPRLIKAIHFCTHDASTPVSVSAVGLYTSHRSTALGSTGGCLRLYSLHPLSLLYHIWSGKVNPLESRKVRKTPEV